MPIPIALGLLADYALIRRIVSANYLIEIIDIAIGGRIDELEIRESGFSQD